MTFNPGALSLTGPLRQFFSSHASTPETPSQPTRNRVGQEGGSFYKATHKPTTRQQGAPGRLLLSLVLQDSFFQTTVMVRGAVTRSLPRPVPTKTHPHESPSLRWP